MKKMYIVLNEDIKDIMNNPGYACAQASHAAFDYTDSRVKYYKNISNIDIFPEYKIHHISSELNSFRFNGNKIIILGTNQKEIEALNELGYLSVIDRDKGGIITAVNLGIYDEKEVPDFIKKMKLYRGSK